MKKIIAGFIAIVMLSALIPTGVFAAEMQTGRFVSETSELVRRYSQKAQGETESGAYGSARLVVRAEKKPSADGVIETAGGYNGYYLLQFSTPDEAEKACAELSRESYVSCVCPDVVMTLCDTGKADYEAVSWGYDAVNAGSFNDFLAENFNAESLPEIIVAVLDTGADMDHPMLEGRLTKGYDFYGADDDPEDDEGHGTHVAGIIADLTLPNVKIMPLKVGSGRDVWVSLAIAGIEYAVENGADVMNMSFGGEEDNIPLPTGGTATEMLTAAIDEAYAAGVLTVAASGNETDDTENRFPANAANAITVAAVANGPQGYVRVPYSNYGDEVDIAAPGAAVQSAAWNGETVYKSGTSMAAPHVAAAAAMMYTYFSCESAFGTPTPASVRSALLNAATDLGEEGFDIYYGYGMLNLSGIQKIFEAKNGDTYYESFTQALAEASDGDTVQLLREVEITQSAVIDRKLSVTGGGMRRGEGFTGALIQVAQGGELTLGGGGFALDGAGILGESAIICSGRLTVLSGTYTGCRAENGGVIKLLNGSAALLGGTFTGNSATGNGGAVYYGGGELSAGGAVEIYGNTVGGAVNNVYAAQGKYIKIVSGLTGSVGITYAGGFAEGTKFAQAESGAVSGLNNLLPDGGDVSAAFAAEDTESPYDIVWAAQAGKVTVSISGEAASACASGLNGRLNPYTGRMLVAQYDESGKMLTCSLYSYSASGYGARLYPDARIVKAAVIDMETLCCFAFDSSLR